MNFIEILVASLAGTHATYWLIHRRKMDSIRATATVNLIYVGLSFLSAKPPLLSLQTVVFGSSFVAMSEPHRLSEKQVLLGSALFALLYYALKAIDFFRFHGGVGGTLGCSAFVACLLVLWIQLAVDRIGKRREQG